MSDRSRRTLASLGHKKIITKNVTIAQFQMQFANYFDLTLFTKIRGISYQHNVSIIEEVHFAYLFR